MFVKKEDKYIQWKYLGYFWIEYNQEDSSINNGHHLDKHIQADPAVEIRVTLRML